MDKNSEEPSLKAPRLNSAADAILALSDSAPGQPSQVSGSIVLQPSSGSGAGPESQGSLTMADMATLFTKFNDMAASLTAMTQQIQYQQHQQHQQQLQLAPAIVEAAQSAATAAVRIAEEARVDSVGSSTPIPMDGPPPPMTVDHDNSADLSLAKLKSSLGNPLVVSISKLVNEFKNGLAEIEKQDEKVKKFDEDITKITIGNTPNGYKPFKCGAGPPLFAEPAGLDSSLEFKFQTQWSFRDAKEKALLHFHKINATLDLAHAKKLKEQVESKAGNFAKLLDDCKLACFVFDKKFDDVSGPPGLISANQDHAVELATRLYKEAMIGAQLGRDKVDLEKAKVEKKKTTLLEEVTSMTNDQLKAAVAWQKAGAAKSLKFNSAVDYIRLQTDRDNGIEDPVQVTTILKDDSNVDEFLAQSSKRQHTKKELAALKANKGKGKLQGNVKSPGEAQGQNQTPGKGKGKGKEKGENVTKGKGKGKGKGKTSPKGKGKGKGKTGKSAAGADGKGGKAGKKN